MKSTIVGLQHSLANAVRMIDESHLLSNELSGVNLASQTTHLLDFTQSSSLLEKCEQVTSKYRDNKPVIRVLHHFACSGGTLISKCIASQPNVFLLSEVHPDTSLHHGVSPLKYAPSDISLLSKYAGIPNDKLLRQNLFLQSVKDVFQHLQNIGGTLVLRDHTHADFCVGDNANEPALIELLAPHFNIESVLTVRNPIDSYLSLEKKGWLHFEPTSFDEYCNRYLEMLSCYKNVDTFKYEDFVLNPTENLSHIAKSLDITYSDDAISIFNIFNLTGDSGRQGDVIEVRPPKKMDEGFQKEVDESNAFVRICELLNYV